MTTEKKSEEAIAILSEVTPIASGKLMHESTEKLSLVEQVQAHCILKKVESAVKSRLSELHDPLMKLAEATGASTDGGHRQLDVDGSKVVVEHRKSKLPSDEGIRKLLKEANLPLTDAFDEVKTLQLNASKLDYLVQTGKLKKEQIDAYIGETQALKVVPSKFLKEAVSSIGFTAKKELSE